MIEPMPGYRVGNYILESVIGSGTFGEVWRARHHEGIRMAAVKIATDPQYVCNLRHERTTVHGLRHPNIVRVFEFDPYSEPPYLAMELVEGPSLEQVLKAHPKGIGLEPAKSVMRGLLKGLGAAHKAGLVHRDIKPANLLLARPIEEIALIRPQDVKITDFGLGHAADMTTGSILQSGSLRTENGRSIAGTLAYMSPEQREGLEVDPRSDLYACGIILFELLTGERPQGNELPSSLNPIVPPALDEVFRRSYARLSLRYSSAPRMAEALDGTRAEIVPSIPRERPTSAPLTSELALGLDERVKLELVLIPSGEFMMGSPRSEEGRKSNEGPQHLVRIGQPFYMGKFEVTWSEWKVIMLKGGFLNDHPVVDQPWVECQDFCRRLSQKFRRTVRLPTEAEWEYACRAGTTTPFHYGKTISTDQANFDGRRAYGNGSIGIYRRKTMPVGSFSPNAWGLYDMHGNVWELCEDLWHKHYARAPTDGSARLDNIDWGYRNFPLVSPAPDDHALSPRVVRGGAWSQYPADCRSAARRATNHWGTRRRGIGFRIVVEAI